MSSADNTRAGLKAGTTETRHLVRPGLRAFHVTGTRNVVIASLFTGVDAGDPTILALAPLILVVTGLSAALVASAGVFRADPAETLRAE